MNQIVVVQLETGHINSSGVAWYAYCKGELDLSEYFQESDFQREICRIAEENQSTLGLEFDNRPIEVPNNFSEQAGFRRYWVASAV